VRKPAFVIAGLVLLGIAVWTFRSHFSRDDRSSLVEKPTSEGTATGVVAITSSSSSAGPAGQPGPLLGETILRGYADRALPPENDLTLMAHLMENSVLLLKSAANRPLSANEDWADFFRGRNSARERFLPDQHVALNTNGQLVDRWGGPLFFHALGGGRYELRSAGPDKRLWTADDIHRNADGSFRHGADLDPAALMETDTGRSGVRISR
jgi:hypothetical protein